MLRAKDVRERFPNPVRAKSSGEGYCVIGALDRVLGGCRSFPIGGVEFILTMANYKLPYYKAEYFATRIIKANDTGNFECAWAILDEALTWGHSTEPLVPTDEQVLVPA